jgi:FkbM family methyltransferase
MSLSFDFQALLRPVVEGDVDLVVQAAFFRNPAYKGTMVEVGAAKPDYLSVSASFRSLGWRVVSIEPNPYFCDLHRQKGFDIIECACGESDRDDASFFVVQTNGIYHGQQVTGESFSSLGVRGKYANLMKSVPSLQKEIKVKVRRLDTLLQENAPDISAIDLVCIDVEGWELEVLNGLSFETYTPKVLIVENLFSEASYSEYLAKKGYVLWRRLDPNEIFVRAELLA